MAFVADHSVPIVKINWIFLLILYLQKTTISQKTVKYVQIIKTYILDDHMQLITFFRSRYWRFTSYMAFQSKFPSLYRNTLRPHGVVR